MSGSKDNSVKIWDVASARNRPSDGRNGVDSSAPLAEQMRAAAAAAAATGGGEGRRGGALAVAGTKRKNGAGGGGGVAGGGMWPMRGDGPSHGPVHSFGTRNTAVIRCGWRWLLIVVDCCFVVIGGTCLLLVVLCGLC